MLNTNMGQHVTTVTPGQARSLRCQESQRLIMWTNGSEFVLLPQGARLAMRDQHTGAMMIDELWRPHEPMAEH